MLPDGKTWKITLNVPGDCAKAMNSITTRSEEKIIELRKEIIDKCFAKYEPDFQSASAELCGKQVERMFGRKMVEVKPADQIHLLLYVTCK
jgi:hypothetical protein